MQPPVRLGIDVGGTFTDLVAQGESGATAVRKVPSTPANPANGVVNAIETLFETTTVTPGDIESLFHGSTVTTNALLERDGATTGLLLTDGFDAVPIVGTQARPSSDTINPFYSGRDFLIPPRRTEEVVERVGSDGEVRQPLDIEDVREAAQTFREQGVESVAVSYLFSFVHPGHEERTRDIFIEEHPKCHVSLSSEVAPRIREYSRLSTTAIDAYVTPQLSAYLSDLATDLDDLGVTEARRFFMLSHGGLVPFETAVDNGCRTLLSGPAAGVMAGKHVGADLGYENLVTMDMGGTSCDVSVIVDGTVPETTESKPAGFPLSVPTVDIGAIGAGGGTQAGESDGRLSVGPESVGADPGPVCYGRGGTEPTVTDADVVLGRLSRDSLLGGEIDVAADRAKEAIAERVGDPLHMDPIEAAAAVLELVTDEMRTEVRLRLSRRGHDPREFSLFAYGGAGPTHAARLADRLDIPRVLIPRHPGVNSALGLLTTDIRGEHARSKLQALTDVTAADMNDAFVDLERQAVAAREDEGFEHEEIETQRRLDLRYEGQGYELTVPVDSEGIDRERIRESFDQLHEERYGHRGEEPLEIVTYRVTSKVPVKPPELSPSDDAITAPNGGDGGETPPKPAIRRDVYDFDAGAFRETPVYDRTGLAGRALDGPAVVEQLDTTIVIEAGQRARFDRAGNAVIEVSPDV